MDDFVFTFDTKPFTRGIKQISQGFTSLKDKASNFTKTAGKGVSSFFRRTRKESEETQKVMVDNFGQNSKNMISALTKRVAGLAAAYVGVRAVLKHIPEIGRAFQHAGNILARNLLWPLRKVLIPMLNNMLSWVREHRAMFVRWGTILANIFRVVVTVIKGAIKLVRSFVDSFISRFEHVFGKVTSRMSDIVNIIMFKVTAIVQYLIAILEPAMKKIGSFFGGVFSVAKGFFDGMIEGIGNVTEPLLDLLGIFTRLLDTLTGSNDSTKELVKTFKTLGTFIGGSLRIIITSFLQLLDTAVFGVQSLVSTVKLGIAWVKGNQGDVERIKKEFGETFEGFKGRFFERTQTVGEARKRVTRAIIPKELPTKKGPIGIVTEKGIAQPTKGKFTIPKQPIKVETKPKIEIKPIIKSKSKKEQKEIKVSNNINVGDISVNVSSEIEAKKAGEQIGEGIFIKLHDQLRKQVNDAFMGVAS